MVGPLQNADLPTGSAVLDAKPPLMMAQLENIYARLPTASVDVLFLAWNGPEPPAGENRSHGVLYYNNPDQLGAVSDVLQSQSKRMVELASLGQGNAPIQSRSLRVN